MPELNRFSRTGWLAATLVAAWLAVPARTAAQVPNEGVTVHGHWVVEVRNADGTLHTRHEFRNALVDRGRQTMAAVLGGERISIWLVQVVATTGIQGCTGNGVCTIAEPTFRAGQAVHSSVFRNLTKTVGTSSVVLQGSFVAAAAAQLSEVRTATMTDPEAPGFGDAFTAHTLASPIAVQPTQTVSVTVTFTFS